jgi:hypothetical protein
VTDDAELRRVSAENGIASMSRSELLAGFS